MKKSDIDFIPARESRWFILLFDLYMRTLFWRRFKNIWIDPHYLPGPDSRTIYYLNHTSWWDGLIPLLLNRKLFRQNARAMMEDKQMKKHGLFKRIGAFSVHLENPRSAIRSMRYAVESMKRPNSSLFIYPEGKINPFHTKGLQFRDGLGWIAGQLESVDVVPIGIYIHTANHDKPELFLKMGTKVEYDPKTARKTLNRTFELALESVLEELQHDAHSDTTPFQKL